VKSNISSDDGEFPPALAIVTVRTLEESGLTGVLHSWLVDDGQIVGIGQPIIQIEIAGVMVQEVATVAGRIGLIGDVGDEIKDGEIVAVIHSDHSAQFANINWEWLLRLNLKQIIFRK